MLETDLQALERFAVENKDLLLLEEQIGRFNIFDALRIARVEIRHSNYLAWLLSPGESHGQGDLFLKAVLMDVLRKARGQSIPLLVSPIELDGADLQGVEIRREWRSIDMLITCDDPRFVIAIENKVDSGEHSNQLQRYEEIVAAEFPNWRRLFVFLTAEGEEASATDWVTCSYADLHQVFSRTRKINAGAIGGDVAVFLDHYLNLIGSRFMENEEIDKLCRQIYSNHRRALDLIWERASSSSSELIGRIEKWITERPDQWHLLATKSREVRFIPTTWAEMLPAVGGKDYPQHWVNVCMETRDSKLRLRVEVCPTNDQETRKRVLERILNDKAEFGFSTKGKEPQGKWTRVLSTEVCSLPEDDEPDLDAVMGRVPIELSEILKRTEKLPAALKALFR